MRRLRKIISLVGTVLDLIITKPGKPEILTRRK